MKKLLVFLVTAVLILSLAGCSGSDNGGKNPENGTDNVTTTVAPTEEVKNTATPEVTATITPAPTEELVPTETVTPDPKPTAEPTAEPTPEPEKTDINRILDKYNDFLTNEYIGNEPDISSSPVKYALGFVNEDDIPELFITDGYVHAYGTKVYTCYEDEVVYAGEFGENGGFAFTPYKNNIYSFHYGMGVSTNIIYSMNADGTCQQKVSFMSDENGVDPETDEECGILYYVNGEKVGEDVYAEERGKYYFDDVPNWSLDYFENFASYADTTYHSREILRYMYDNALEGRIFTGYVSPALKALVGEWQFVKAVINDSEHDVYGTFEGEKINSSLRISTDFYADYWLSAWVLNDGEDTLFRSNYAMPIDYDDYEINLMTDTDDVAYSVTLSTDENGVETLELYEFYGYNEETGWENSIRAYYHRADVVDPVGNEHFGILRVCPELQRNDGTFCYQLEEYLWITPDTDPAIIAQYGFAPDLDGYDYELVQLEQEPLTVYASEFTPSDQYLHYTCYELLDETLMKRYADCEEFYDKVNDSYDGIYVKLYIEDGTDIANFISEEYTG